MVISAVLISARRGQPNGSGNSRDHEGIKKGGTIPCRGRISGLMICFLPLGLLFMHDHQSVICQPAGQFPRMHLRYRLWLEF